MKLFLCWLLGCPWWRATLLSNECSLERKEWPHYHWLVERCVRCGGSRKYALECGDRLKSSICPTWFTGWRSLGKSHDSPKGVK